MCLILRILYLRKSIYEICSRHDITEILLVGVKQQLRQNQPNKNENDNPISIYVLLRKRNVHTT